MANRITGIVISVPIAHIGPQTIPCSVWKEAKLTGNVFAIELVRNKAIVKSFQLNIKDNAATDASPGVIRGKTIFAKTENEEQPSILAHSSTSLGTPSINPFKIQVARGTFKEV